LFAGIGQTLASDLPEPGCKRPPSRNQVVPRPFIFGPNQTLAFPPSATVSSVISFIIS